MDPLAFAALIGLVFAGKTLSEQTERYEPETTIPHPRSPEPIYTRRDIDLMANTVDNRADAFDVKPTNPQMGRRIGDWRLQPKDAVQNMQEISPTNNRLPYGQPVYDLYNREYVTNKQNNISPLETPNNVGPGIGVGANVVSSGGFQDYFRALPINTNEERLTTLEGRSGPSNPHVKNGGAAYIGDITKGGAITKTAFRETAPYGGGGTQIGPEGRPEFLKTKMMTRRAESGSRTDTLSDGPPQYNVTQPYAIGKESYTNKNITRVSGYRENPDRAGNAQRMNVRNDPVNQIGAASQLRVESLPVPPGPMGITGSNQGRGINPPTFEPRLNEFKEIPNPRAQPDFLDIAIQQLEKNELAHSLGAVSVS